MAFNGTVTAKTPVFKLQANDGGFINAGIYDIDFAAANYPAAGEPILPTDFDANADVILGVYLLGLTDGAAVALDILVDLENSKIIVIDIADALPFAAATNLSGVSARVLVVWQ